MGASFGQLFQSSPGWGDRGRALWGGALPLWVDGPSVPIQNLYLDSLQNRNLSLLIFDLYPQMVLDRSHFQRRKLGGVTSGHAHVAYP